MASQVHNCHDHSYKLMFSHKQMMQDLLTGFVRKSRNYAPKPSTEAQPVIR